MWRVHCGKKLCEKIIKVGQEGEIDKVPWTFNKSWQKFISIFNWN